MITYKIHPDLNVITRINPNDSFTSFMFDNDNSDYVNFKKQINSDEAQIQDVNEKIMSSNDAKTFVATLP